MYAFTFEKSLRLVKRNFYLAIIFSFCELIISLNFLYLLISSFDLVFRQGTSSGEAQHSLMLCEHLSSTATPPGRKSGICLLNNA